MRKLNDNMKLFCEEYVKNGYNGRKAYEIAYEQDNKNVCAVEAHKLLKDQRIQEEINNVELSFRIAGFDAGIDKKAIMKILCDMMFATKKVFFNGEEVGEIPDHMARNNAITTWAKLTGDFTEKKKLEIEDHREIEDIDPTKISKEEAKEIEKKLLNQL